MIYIILFFIIAAVVTVGFCLWLLHPPELRDDCCCSLGLDEGDEE